MFIDKIVLEYKLIDTCITKTFFGSFELLELVFINNVLINVNRY